jgi:peptide chain release factor 1
MAELAREEVAAQSQALDELSSRLKVLLLPRDPLDERNIMLEVRGVPSAETWLLE